MRAGLDSGHAMKRLTLLACRGGRRARCVQHACGVLHRSAAWRSAAAATPAPSAARQRGGERRRRRSSTTIRSSSRYISFAVAEQLRRADAQGRPGRGRGRQRQARPCSTATSTPATQVKQLQDAVASGKYDGIILQPVYGAGLVEGAKAAIAAGIAVGNIDQILGADNTTADLQVPGQLVERRVRPERARPQDRRAGRQGLRGHQPVQRRLHLLGQGGRPRRVAQGGVRQGDRGQPGHQGRRRGRVVLHDRARPQGRPGHAARRTRRST